MRAFGHTASGGPSRRLGIVVWAFIFLVPSMAQAQLNSLDQNMDGALQAEARRHAVAADQIENKKFSPGPTNTRSKSIAMASATPPRETNACRRRLTNTKRNCGTLERRPSMKTRSIKIIFRVFALASHPKIQCRHQLEIFSRQVPRLRHSRHQSI